MKSVVAKGQGLFRVQENLENGRLVLAALKHYAVSSGETLLVQNITAYAWLHNRATIEVKAGIRHAIDNHWITKLPNGAFMLTEDGFAKISANEKAEFN